MTIELQKCEPVNMTITRAPWTAPSHAALRGSALETEESASLSANDDPLASASATFPCPARPGQEQNVKVGTGTKA